MKNICKTVVFMIIFFSIWTCCFEVLVPTMTSIDSFYDENKNSLDLVYVGSSNANNHFNSVLAYNEFGFTTGLLSSESQHPSTIKHLLQESMKYQKPEVYVIDITRFKDMLKFEDISELNQINYRKTIDAMNFNKNKLNAIEDLIKYNDIPRREYITYYFNHILYHDSWREIGHASFDDEVSGWYRFYKGYQYVSNSNNIVPQKKIVWHNESILLSNEIYEILIDLLLFIKDNDLNVLFVLPNIYHSDYDISIFNEVISIIRSYRFDVINFNVSNDFGLDFETDFYEASHFNVYGSIKYTLYFSQYLKQNYDLSDHRRDEKYRTWNEEFKRFKDTFEKETGKKLYEIIKKGK